MASTHRDKALAHAQGFNPSIDVLLPSNASKDTHEGTVRIDHGDTRVHVLFYSDGSYRFRVRDGNELVLDEAFLRGGADKFSIIGLRPKG
jgi:hypothetical protein